MPANVAAWPIEADEPSSELPVNETMDASAASPNTGRSDGVKSIQAEGKKRDNRPLYFKRYKAGSILLELFIIMIAIAFLLYPRRSAVYRPAALNINIYTAGTAKIRFRWPLSHAELGVLRGSLRVRDA